MANYEILKAAIRAVIKENANNEITGDLLQQALISMINSLGVGSRFMGIATPSTNPGTPDQDVFYIASTSGSYTNFDGIVVAENEIAILKYNGAWTKEDTGAASVEKVNELNVKINDSVGLVALLNGSTGNILNTNLVRTPVVRTNGARYAVVWTSRKNRSGCHYTFGYALTSDLSNIGSTQQYADWSGAIVKVDESADNKCCVIDLAQYPNAVGIAFTIGERNSSDVVQSLRDTDFAAELTFVNCDKAISDVSNYIVFGPALFGVPSGNEPFGINYDTANHNITIPSDIVGLYRGINGTNDWKSLPAATLSWPNTESSAIYIVWDLNTSAFRKKIYADKLDDGELFVAAARKNGEKTTMSSIFPWSVDGNLFGIPPQQVIEIANNFNGGVGKALSAEMGKNLNGRVVTLETNKDYTTLLNGSTGNPGNTNFVRTPVVKTNGVRYAILATTRPNRANCYYAYGFALTNSLSDIGSEQQYADWSGALIKVDVDSSLKKNFIVDLSEYPTAVGIAFVIAEYDGGGNVQQLRVDDFENYITFLSNNPATERVVETFIMDKGIVERNEERHISLQAMCRYRKESAMPQKDISILVCTDSHDDTIAVNNAIDAVNGFFEIDAFVHCGDIVGSYPKEQEISTFQRSFTKLNKPGFVCLGNHDVGNAYYVGFCYNEQQAYDAFIKPMVDAGYLTTGEYVSGKCYWLHDIPAFKNRIICLNEFDDPMDLAQNAYWEPVSYNANAPELLVSTTYSVGDIVKCGNYTQYCFKCIAQVTTPSSFYGYSEKIPHFRILRGSRVIREQQANWFLNALVNTPANYGVIIISHQVFSPDALTIDAKFSQSVGISGSDAGLQNNMGTDLIGGALAAFVSGANYSENVAMSGDAEYLNVMGGNTYAYSVSKNFAGKNVGVYLNCVVSGHTHKDLIFKKDNIYNIIAVCATTDIDNATSSDIRRRADDGLTKDSLTVVSVSNGRIALAKIGVNVTDTGKSRDYEVINH